MNKLLKLVTFFLIIPLSLSATERSFSISSDFSECDSKYNETSVMTEYANFKYDDVTEELYVDVAFSSTSGTPANGFQFGINSDSSIYNNTYRLPYFYVDGYNAVNNTPKVSAFIFNRELHSNLNECNNTRPSYVTDPAVNINKSESILSNGSFITLASVVTTVAGGKTTNTFSLILDMSLISAFDPRGPNDGDNSNVDSADEPYAQKILGNNKQNLWYWNRWNGFEFSDEITFDFVPSVISNSSYTSKLDSLTIDSCSFCRVEREDTNDSPTCTITQQLNEVFPGEEATYKFQVSDTENDSQYVVFGGVNTNDTVTNPVDSSTLLDGTIATLDWTPTIADQGKEFTITANFVQDYGTVNASSNTCTTTVTVNDARGIPVCEQIDISSDRTLALNKINKISSQLISLNKQSLKMAKRLKIKEPNDYSSSITSITGATFGYIFELPEVFTTCSLNPDNVCDTDDYFGHYQRHQNEIKTLYCDKKVSSGCNFINNIGVKLLREWKKRKIKTLMKKLKITKAEAKPIAVKAFINKRNKLRKLAKSSISNVNGFYTNPGNLNYTCP